MKARFDIDSRTPVNGKCKVRMRVSVNGTSAYIPTGVMCEPSRLYPSDLDMPIHHEGKRVTETDRECNAVLTKLVDKYRNAESTIAQDGRIKTITANEVKEMIVGTRHKIMYLEAMQSVRDTRFTDGTKYAVLCAIRKMRVWLRANGYGEDIEMEMFTRAMALDMVEWMQNSLGASTLSQYITYIKVAWRRASDRGLISCPDPWSGISLPTEPIKDIEVLTADQMRAFLGVQPKNTLARRAQSVGFISFALCGVNMKDIWMMRRSTQDEVVFIREKTKRKNQRPVHIRIEPELAMLISENAGRDTLFNYCDILLNIASFKKSINQGMYSLSDELGFQVNMSLIRRTWATIAEDLDVNRVVVDMAMGHAARDVTGRHYAKFNWERVADANRKVLDYVLYDKK